MKKILTTILTVVLIITALPLAVSNSTVSALTYDYYTFSLSNGKAIITDVDTSISGKVIIPSTLLGYSVTSIDSYAFKGCIYITSITIPDSVTSIGSYAFNGCRSITSIIIPDNVTSIGSYAFSDCSCLTNVTIGEGITSISSYVFSSCNALTKITIPNSVTSIGSYAFFYCRSLTKITIPDSVRIIDSSAFSSCLSLTSITLPNSVTSIGYSAFADCISLTNISLDDSVTSIGSSAFANTGYYNNEANWEDNVLYIGKHLIEAKADVFSSYAIRYGTLTIADRAFSSCSSITSITIPDSVRRIGSYAFSGCSFITSITIPDSVKIIDSSAFSGCSSITSITIPDNVTSIGSSVFADCTSLTSISIGYSVTSVGSSAFANTGYYNNEANWEDDVLYIGKHLIEAKNNILSCYTIKKGTLAIADRAFSNCSSITSITIPDSVRSIGSYAFSGCSSITSITVPDNVTRIGSSAFSDCGYLTSVIIGNSVTSIGYEVFYYCTRLESITISNNVISIGYSAFNGCSNLKSVYYRGGKAYKSKITIGSNNSMLTNAIWYCNSCIGSAEHTYDNGYDIECNICSFGRSAPKLAYKHSDTVALVPIYGYEYSYDGVNWQTNNIFTGLSENTTFYFFQRPEHSLEKSNLSLAVTLKSSQVTPDAPIVLGYSDTVIQLRPQSNMEYSLDGIVWQKSNVFAKLSPATEYSFYQRLAENDFSEASAASDSTSFTTAKIEQVLIPAAPTVLEVTSSRVILTPVVGCEYSIDGITWQSGNVFDNLSYSTEYTFYQRYAETDMYQAGATSKGKTVKTLKGVAPRPYNAPTLESKTHNYVVLNSVDGYEYSMDGVNWQSSNVFIGLLPKMNYTFYQRVAENDVYHASSASPALEVKTNAKPQYTLGDINGDTKINLKDLVTIAQYAAGWENVEFNDLALDVNGDYTVDLQDINHLARYLAGWEDAVIY